MKKLKLFILSLCLIAQLGFAQGRQPKPGRRLEALKTAYVTKQLNLTTEEAEKFWPVYRNYAADLHKMRQEQRGGDVLELEENVLNLRKKYRGEFKKVLNADDRATRALIVERDFNNMIRKEWQQRMEMRKEKGRS
jgi:nitrate reductase assembly molybdenum cofactor insertion protein NarJ